MKIALVPHPSRQHIRLPDGRGLYCCSKCNDKIVEPFNRASHKPVACACGGECRPHEEVLFKDQMGITIDGSMVAYCKAEPSGWIARCHPQPMAEFIRDEIKAVVDATFHGNSVWTDTGMIDDRPEDDDTIQDIDEDEDYE